MPTISTFCFVLVFLVVLLTSCSGPAPTPTIFASPLHCVTANQGKSSHFGHGSSLRRDVGYSDASGDMAISFLDVISFQASVDDASETP